MADVMESTSSVFTTKYAGVPGYVWAGGVVLSVYLFKKMGNKTTLNAADPMSADAATTAADQTSPGVVYGGVGAQAGTGVTTTTTTPADSGVTLEAWLLKAQQIASADGFSAYEASQALRAYATGSQTTDPRMLQIINDVVPKAGAAPGLTYAGSTSDSAQQVIGFVRAPDNNTVYEVNYTTNTKTALPNIQAWLTRAQRYSEQPEKYKVTTLYGNADVLPQSELNRLTTIADSRAIA